MAEKRGGRRVPEKPASRSGIGKNSKRTDGQPIRVPNVQDSTDLNIGDRATLEHGQRVAPLARASRPSPQPVASPGLSAGNPRELPSHIFEMPSTDPMEPPTEGLAQGPGRGPEALSPQPSQDRREMMLAFMVEKLQSESVRQLLEDYRAERAQPDEPAVPQRLTPPPPPEFDPEEEPLRAEAPELVPSEEPAEPVLEEEPSVL